MAVLPRFTMLYLAPSDLQTPLANGVYFTVIINKTPLHNGNCPITNLIAEMGVEHTVGQYLLMLYVGGHSYTN